MWSLTNFCRRWIDSDRNAKNEATPDVMAAPGAKNQQDEKKLLWKLLLWRSLSYTRLCPGPAGVLGNVLAASRSQDGNENASSNRKGVFQNCNSQIRPVTAEPLAHVITGKGSPNRSRAA